MSNARFSDYSTSGAFAIGLSRHQVASLAMIANGGSDGVFVANAPALERKGLAEMVAAPKPWNAEGTEWRATLAGLFVARLLSEAGLTNGPPDPVAAEFADLRAQLEAARQEVAEAQQRATSAFARLDEARQDLELERARTDRDYRPKLIIKVRDPRPDLEEVDLRAWAGVEP